jgi:hypothetical protein
MRRKTTDLAHVAATKTMFVDVLVGGMRKWTIVPDLDVHVTKTRRTIGCVLAAGVRKPTARCPQPAPPTISNSTMIRRRLGVAAMRRTRTIDRPPGGVVWMRTLEMMRPSCRVIAGRRRGRKAC